MKGCGAQNRDPLLSFITTLGVEYIIGVTGQDETESGWFNLSITRGIIIIFFLFNCCLCLFRYYTSVTISFIFSLPLFWFHVAPTAAGPPPLASPLPPASPRPPLSIVASPLANSTATPTALPIGLCGDSFLNAGEECDTSLEGCVGCRCDNFDGYVPTDPPSDRCGCAESKGFTMNQSSKKCGE